MADWDPLYSGTAQNAHVPPLSYIGPGAAC